MSHTIGTINGGSGCCCCQNKSQTGGSIYGARETTLQEVKEQVGDLIKIAEKIAENAAETSSGGAVSGETPLGFSSSLPALAVSIGEMDKVHVFDDDETEDNYDTDGEEKAQAIYSHHIQVKCIGGTITDDLRLLIGYWNPAKHRICWYNGGRREDRQIFPVDISQNSNGIFYEIPYTVFDIFMRGVRTGKEVGSDWRETKFYKTITPEQLLYTFKDGNINKAVGEPYMKIKYNQRNIYLTGGDRGNGFGNCFYLALARVETEDAKKLVIKELGQPVRVYFHVRYYTPVLECRASLTGRPAYHLF